MSFSSPVNGSSDANRKIGAKLDNGPWRAEITARTNAGESCQQVAEALTAKGFPVSTKSISRWRVQWGLRRRVEPKTKGRSLSVPHLRRVGGKSSNRIDTSKVSQDLLADLTRQGKTAEEIVEILEAQGAVLKRGASTVWRLQTFWGLVESDVQRRKGNGKYRKGENVKKGRPRKNAEAAESNVADAATSNAVLHYPSNCSFGPQKRAPKAAAAGTVDIMDDDSDADGGDTGMMDDDDISSTFEDEPSPTQQTFTPSSRKAMQSPAIASVADHMSAELLVDLANSALIAAIKHKDLVFAAQVQKPMAGSTLPPTAQEIVTARRKVREATSVVMDLVGG